MNKRFSSHELHELRNLIPVTRLIRDDLSVPSKVSEGGFRFLCPLCNEFQTATQPATNLARCFRCEKNFNPIDLVMAVKGWSFVDSCLFLQQLLKNESSGKADTPMRLEALAADVGFPMPGGR